MMLRQKESEYVISLGAQVDRQPYISKLKMLVALILN